METSEVPKNNKKTRMKTFLVIIAINIFLIFIILLGFEIYFRATMSHVVNRMADTLPKMIDSSPQLLTNYTSKGRRLIPNADVVLRNHHVSKRDINVKINSAGFRDTPLSEKKSPNEIRILVLGDSITFGSYLQAEEVYVERIENRLQKSIDKIKIEVINAGVWDIGLREMLHILDERGLDTDPDAVVIAFYLNDSRPPWGFPNELGSMGFLRKHSLLAQVIYSRMVFKEWIKMKGKSRFEWLIAKDKLDWKNNRSLFMNLVSYADNDWGAAWKDDSWIVVEEQFKTLKKISEINNFKTAVVAFPVSFQVYADFIEDKPQKKLREITRKFGYDYFDLLPVLRKYRDEDLFFDQCHPKVRANDIIGNAIAGFLEEKVVPEILSNK